MENALSCWLTERTCPYADGQAVTIYGKPASSSPMLKEWGPEWSNRICERICLLDKVSSGLRGRSLTNSEDRAVDMALRKAIVAFATQWANSSHRSAAEFSNELPLRGLDQGAWNIPQEFDRSMQESFWHEARNALRDTAEIESFRVIFAHIIFALTQKPLNIEEKFRELKLKKQNASTSSNQDILLNSNGYSSSPSNSYRLTSIHTASTSANGSNDPAEPTVLGQILELAGPPVFLETALRQIFAFRCKLEKIEARAKKQMRKNWPSIYPDSERANPFRPEDLQTFNLLLWLGIMFDTLSSAFHMRPLVVSDEDSDVHQSSVLDKGTPDLQFAVHTTRDNAIQINVSQNSRPSENNKDSHLWDDFLLKKKEKIARQEQSIVRWPCSYDIAAATLCDAAPIKVLMFRKVTRLQTILSRRVGSQSLELAISDALSIHDYWNTFYGPFMSDCISSHENLPPRIQSWYVILCGHWHLAQFLLADIIEEIDEEELGSETGVSKRRETSLVEKLRRQNAYTMSDLGKASCPRTSGSFARAKEFHAAVNKGAILTEPWTEVLVRSFSKAGSVLVDLLPAADSVWSGQHDFDELKFRCNHCIEALWHLGKKSDIALLASRALSYALEEKTEALNATFGYEGNGLNGLNEGFENHNICHSNFSISEDIREDMLESYLSNMENEGLIW
jgi:hypothetical protein